MNKNLDSLNALQYLPISATWLDHQLNFQGGNAQFFSTFNLKEEQIIGTHFTSLFDSYALISFINDFVQNKLAHSEINQSLQINNKLIHFKFLFQKYESNGDKIVVCIEDISSLVEKNQELEALRTKSMQSSRMAILGELTSGIAHEINNPLTIILNHAEKLRNHFLSTDSSNQEDSIRRIDKILNTSQRIEKIVKSLRMFTRDGSKDPFKNTSISSLINESLEICSETLKYHQIQLIIDSIDPALTIDCRSTQISQIILNLIGNSKDAILNLDEKWIKIEVADIGECVRFSLTDSGNGIPKAIANQLTEAFFTTKEAGSGTGLGLSISKTIIDSHFGQLFVDHDCLNTKFVFDIPKGLSEIT